MEPFIFYLIKSVIWLTGFSLIYLLFLRNERFFRIKRIYLVAGILASFLFPLISFHYNIEISGPQATTFAQIISASNDIQNIEAVSNGKNLNYKYILLFVYISGMIILAIRMVKHIRALSGIIMQNESSRRGSARIIRVPEIKSPFSFFNYVFISPVIRESDAEQILNHEEVHVQQKHWFDLLLAEIVRMLQWANPFAWIYTSFIIQNHEYLADEVALRRTSDPAAYRAVLLNQMFNVPVITLSNSFSYSTSKKRFDMMKKIISSPWRKLRILFILPVIALVFYAFAVPEYHYSAPGIDGTVKGKVLNEENKPMFGVIVTLSDGSAFLTTDQNGNFTMSAVPENASLVFTFSGFKSLKLPADFSKEMIVRLTKDPDVIPDELKIVPPPATSPGQSPDQPLWIVDGVIREDKGWIDPNTINTVSILKGESATAVFGEKGKNGVIVVTLKKGAPLSQDVLKADQKISDDNYDGKAYKVVEKMPQFPGGDAELLKFIFANTHYPDSAKAKNIQGKVIARFIVNQEGKVEDVRIQKGVHPLLDEEAIRVISLLPDFTPGYKGGRPVEVYYMVPITFKLK